MRQGRLSAFLKAGARVRFPVIPGIHHLLLWERRFRKDFLRVALAKTYYEPLLRMSCQRVGSGLYLFENMPKILGNLVVTLGNEVSLEGEQVWIGAGSGQQTHLEIGDNSYVGHATQLVSGTSIRIGKHVLIANGVLLNGYDGHPLDPLARARNEPPGPHGMGAIEVEDYAWIGNRAVVLKNVRIGRGAVVATGSVVTKDVPDLTIVAGIPARTVSSIEAPPGW